MKINVELNEEEAEDFIALIQRLEQITGVVEILVEELKELKYRSGNAPMFSKERH